MKRILVSLVAALVLDSPGLAHAQSSASIPRIGFLTSAPAGTLAVQDLRRGLRELAYVEGKDFVLEARYAEGRYDWLPDLAQDLVDVKVDVIVTSSTETSLSAQRATKTIPIVMAGGGDPVAAGLVRTLARPGGNITGVTTVSADLGKKRLEILKEIAPQISLVAVLSVPNDAAINLQMKELAMGAHALQLRLFPVEVEDPNAFANAFAAMSNAGADSLIVLSAPMFRNHRFRIAELAARSRLPAIYPDSDLVDGGGLASYAATVPELYRRAAYYVHRILKHGAKPADLPVEKPTKFELVINRSAADQIGLTIPEPLLQRADRVVR